ncbi:MAG: cobalamin-dependent protein [Clostridia bacterium]|nr:cobalamin-dependent protein [Clostridia bacterium]
MKKVYFVQVGFEFDGSVYLPYAAGTLIAYCLSQADLKTEYDFADIIFRREQIADALEKIKDPYLVAFSCSVWNTEYDKALAKAVREKHPDCIITFGGHSVDEDASMLESEPYIDFLTFGEGETVFAEVLRKIPRGEYSLVPSIAYRENGKVVKTPKKCAEGKEIPYPSPYLTGVFDRIIDENPGMEFLSVLETNRGCPYNCAYCDWVTGRKMRFFPMEKVLAEIEWLALHKIAYCFCADSNFGMFDRDYEIAQALVAAKRKYGFPQVFRPCYEKNSADRVFRICSLLNSEGMDKGATMAYQTLSDAALEKIGRKNLTMEHFSSLMKKYNEAGIPTYSELILGLPGETKESFCQGICKLMENGQHNSLSVYHCEMLPNSDLSRPEFIKENKIKVIKVGFNHIHSAPDKNEEIPEYSYLVRSTSTMNDKDWVQANLFSVCTQCFHSLGFLRCFAMYLHEEKGIKFYDFYSGLLDYIMNTPGAVHDLWMNFMDKYENSLAGDWNYHKPEFGHVTWFFEEGAFLEAVTHLDGFMSELLPYIKKYDIESGLFDALLEYQKAVLRKPFDKGIVLTPGYDFPKFFDMIIKGEKPVLEKYDEKIEIKPSPVYDSLPEYAKETVWFGRRRGRTVYGRNEINYLR